MTLTARQVDAWERERNIYAGKYAKARDELAAMTDLARRLARIVAAWKALEEAPRQGTTDMVLMGSVVWTRHIRDLKRELKNALAAVSDDELIALRSAETAQDAANGHPPPSGDAATPVDALAGATDDHSGIREERSMEDTRQ